MIAAFNEISNVLSVLKSLRSQRVDSYLSQSESGTFSLHVHNEVLFEINEKSIFVAGRDFTSRIFPVCSRVILESIDFECINHFFSELKDSFVRLNHLGISYSCDSIADELFEIKNLLRGTDFRLYEEDVDFGDQRWFFVGHLGNWENPLFEIVLTESKTQLCTKWIPHFQIDLDTKLSIEELELFVNSHLKENFIDWKLDIPNYGVVLLMGEVSNTNGFKVFLGLGTSIRNTKYHREELLREVQ